MQPCFLRNWKKKQISVTTTTTPKTAAEVYRIGCGGINRNNNKRKTKYEIIIIAIKMFSFSSDITTTTTTKVVYNTNWKPRGQKERMKKQCTIFTNDFEYILLCMGTLYWRDRRTVSDHHAHKTNIFSAVCMRTRCIYIYSYSYSLCTILHLLYQITGYYGGDNGKDNRKKNKTKQKQQCWSDCNIF